MSRATIIGRLSECMSIARGGRRTRTGQELAEWYRDDVSELCREISNKKEDHAETARLLTRTQEQVASLRDELRAHKNLREAENRDHENVCRLLHQARDRVSELDCDLTHWKFGPSPIETRAEAQRGCIAAQNAAFDLEDCNKRQRELLSQVHTRTDNIIRAARRGASKFWMICHLEHLTDPC